MPSDGQYNYQIDRARNEAVKKALGPEPTDRERWEQSLSSEPGRQLANVGGDSLAGLLGDFEHFDTPSSREFWEGVPPSQVNPRIHEDKFPELRAASPGVPSVAASGHAREKSMQVQGLDEKAEKAYKDSRQIGLRSAPESKRSGCGTRTRRSAP